MQDMFDFLEMDVSVGLNCLAGDHRPKRKVAARNTNIQNTFAK